VMVGHSISAVIATIYAARHPSRGVVNVDQSLQAAPFARLVQSLADKLRGPAFPAVWEMFEASNHIDALPQSAQVLIRSSCHPRADVVLGYWSLLLGRPLSEIAAFAATMLAAVKTAGLPYLVIAGEALEPEYERWLKEAIPQVSVTVLPASGHFPHLAHPALFAQCLAATGRWEADGSRRSLASAGHRARSELQVPPANGSRMTR
jgi:pimeloyl-ACP methyl ester carboxylesterase